MASEGVGEVLERFAAELAAKTDGQVSLVDLEASLDDLNGAVLRDVLRALVQERQAASFPPCEPAES